MNVKKSELIKIEIDDHSLYEALELASRRHGIKFESNGSSINLIVCAPYYQYCFIDDAYDHYSRILQKIKGLKDELVRQGKW